MLRTKRLYRLLGLLALSLAIVASACGGGEETKPTAAPRPAPTVAPQPTATARPAATASAPPTAAPAPTATAAPRLQATPTSAASTAPAGRLRIVVSSFGRENLDPSIETSVTIGTLAGPIYDWLVWNAKDGSLAPGVAASWDMSPDGKVWTYKLRSGMRFHNGDAVTAADVKFSIEWTIRSEASSSNTATWRSFSPVVEAVAADTVRVTVKSAWPLMPYTATPREGSEGVVLSKAYIDRAGGKGASDSPIGTGPFKFARHDGGVRYLYEATGTAHSYRAAPKYKELEYLLVPEESTRLAIVRTGSAEIAAIGGPALLSAKQANLQIFSIPGVTMGGAHVFGWGDARLEGKPLAKKEARKALLLAINRRELVDSLLAGEAEIPARWIMTPGSLGYDPNWKPEPFDPAQAKTLLADAGYPRGFSIRFYAFPHSAATWFPLAAQALAGYWSAIGVNTEIIPTDLGTAGALYRRRPLPDELMGAVMTQLVPVSSTNVGWFPTWYRSTSGSILFFKSPELDALVDQSVSALDPQKQAEAIRKVSDWATAEYINMPLAITPDLYAASPRMTNWNPVRSGRLGMTLEELTPR